MKTRDLKRVRREVEKMRSGEGTPVDEKIKSLVIGLRRWDVQTENSCEGHLSYGCGLPYPWVDVAMEDAQKAVMAVRGYNIGKLQEEGTTRANLWIIKPYAGFLRIMPDNAKDQSLKEMQEDAIRFGKFLQELSEDNGDEWRRRRYSRWQRRRDCLGIGLKC